MTRFQFAFVKTAQMTPWERARFLGADHAKLAALSPDEILSMHEELRATGMDPHKMYTQALRNQPAGAVAPRSRSAVQPKTPAQGRSSAFNAGMSAPQGILSPASTTLHLPHFDPHAPHEDLRGTLLGSTPPGAPRSSMPGLDELGALAERGHAPAAAAHAPAGKSRAGLLGALVALGGTSAAAGTYAVRRKRQQAAAAAQKAKALAEAQQLAARSRAMKHLGIGGALGLGGLGLAHLFHSQDE